MPRPELGAPAAGPGADRRDTALETGAVGRPGGGIGLLARETARLGAPGAAALLGLAAAGRLGSFWLLVGLALTGVAALALAVANVRAARALGVWIRSLASGGTERGAPAVGGAIGQPVRPVLELARALRHERATAAEQARLLNTLIDALPDPILLVDRARLVRRCNPAAVRSFGAAASGLPLGRIVRDPGVLAALDGALDAGHASSVAFNPAGDRFKRFAARIEPVGLPDGEPGALLSMREQSEQVMIERIRSDFVANASHEIRTPLAAIHGFIETLRGPARDDPAAREAFLDTMAQETARLTRLVEDLLSLSRIELEANRPPTGAIALEGVLARVVESLEPVAARRNVALLPDLPSSLPPVRGDGDQLHQLFANLVDNAIKYGGEGTSVRIEATVHAVAPANGGPLAGRACVEVRVVDEGPGIPREHIPRLTERFYRVDTARSRRLGGTGLGLAIVKHILRRHQGHLLIASELGQGSSFAVFLPLAKAAGVEHRHRIVAEPS
ncbi:MAG TPA: ATP-binding protein [Geminicoccaceae bacterium]|nr:ATP-binding protein [Geminicoccaceae bacterium]